MPEGDIRITAEADNALSDLMRAFHSNLLKEARHIAIVNKGYSDYLLIRESDILEVKHVLADEIADLCRKWFNSYLECRPVEKILAGEIGQLTDEIRDKLERFVFEGD